MIALAKLRILALKLCVVLLLAFACAMLVLLWLSGTQETKQALADGKRFVITIADGSVQGKASEAQLAKQEEEKAELAVPPPDAVDEKQLEAVTDVVVASAAPIAPVSEELLDKSNSVALPYIPESGAKPWQHYAKSFRRQNELPVIAIVVGGLGMSKEATDMALALDDRFSLSFSPYAGSVAGWAEASRLSGHEMLVDLPMQTMNYPNDDPGPYGILTKNTTAINTKNLYWAMSRFQGYIGMVVPMNDVVTVDENTIIPVEKELAARGLILLRSREPQQSQDDGKQKKKRPPVVAPNVHVWIDEELTDMAIQARLATLEQMAQRNGYAVGYAGAYPLTITQLKAWHSTLGTRGIMLAPLSFIAKLNYD